MPFWTLKRPADRGQAAEQAACRYLEQQGLKCLQRNYACPLGELDLVMQDAEGLVFVEVRFRNNALFGGPAASVDQRKQKKLTKTAEHFLQQHPQWQTLPCRFDIIAATPGHSNSTFTLEWLQNAISSD